MIEPPILKGAAASKPGRVNELDEKKPSSSKHFSLCEAKHVTINYVSLLYCV
jgi:hypothetical protein